MGNFRYRMAIFLMGRNGFDNFCRGLLFLAMILIIADILCRAAYFACWDSLFWYIHISGLFPRILPGVRPKNAWYTSCAGPVPFIYEPGPQALQVFQMSDMQTGPPGLPKAAGG